MTVAVDPQLESVREAYDRIAPVYDQKVEGDAWMRRALWRHYANVFRPGDHVLDVACGTGLDAVFLARRGMRVTAVDISSGMIEQLRARVEKDGLSGSIYAGTLDVNALSSLPVGSFDGIVSAFAGLSTLPGLHGFAADASALLRPGGHMVLHLLNRFSLWEWLLCLRRGDWEAAHAIGNARDRDFTIGDQTVRHYLYDPIGLYRSVFAHDFQLAEAYALGSLRPPHTLRGIPPPVLNGLEALERAFGGHAPLLNRGRFFVLDLAKRSEAGHAL